MKPIKPVDRVMADVSQKIETVERQLRTIGHATSAQPSRTPLEPVQSFLRRMLTPPGRRTARRPRNDLFESPPVNSLAELNDSAVLLAVPSAQPELFTPAAAAGGKLGQYLASASLRPPKPQLKHVQRENRHRFYLWLGLSFVAVWLIYAVVR